MCNVNHITITWHLPLSCRSILDQCSSLGSCKPQIFFSLIIILSCIRKAEGQFRTVECLYLVVGIILLSMQVQGLMEDTYVRLINCRLNLFRSSASSFSSQYRLPFLKSSRSCVLLLSTPFTFVICHLKEAISSQNMTDPIAFSTQDIIICIILHYNMYYFHFTLQEPC